MKNKIVLMLLDDGDPSVGIWPTEDKVTIETDWNMDEEILNNLKGILKDFFDVSSCITEEEYLEEIRLENEYLDSLGNL